MPSFYLRANFKLPPVPSSCLITNYATIGTPEKEINYVSAREKDGGDAFRIAINPAVFPLEEATLIGTPINEIIQKASTAAHEPFFQILTPLTETQGKVIAARTFKFGEQRLSDLLIEKNSGETMHVVFIPDGRRQRKQGLSLVGKKIAVSSSFIEEKINGRNKIWNGKNF
jgi:hypothetical protein